MPELSRDSATSDLGHVPKPLTYVVETATGQRTLTPTEFANRYGWQNDPNKVRLK